MKKKELRQVPKGSTAKGSFEGSSICLVQLPRVQTPLAHNGIKQHVRTGFKLPVGSDP